MNIMVQENMCWVCGDITMEGKNHTMHHTLPRHLKPKKNVIIPVCKECHEKINQTDVKGMYAFAHKIVKTNQEVAAMSKSLLDAIAQVENQTVERERNKEEQEKEKIRHAYITQHGKEPHPDLVEQIFQNGE